MKSDKCIKNKEALPRFYKKKKILKFNNAINLIKFPVLIFDLATDVRKIIFNQTSEHSKRINRYNLIIKKSFVFPLNNSGNFDKTFSLNLGLFLKSFFIVVCSFFSESVEVPT